MAKYGGVIVKTLLIGHGKDIFIVPDRFDDWNAEIESLFEDSLTTDCQQSMSENNRMK